MINVRSKIAIDFQQLKADNKLHLSLRLLAIATVVLLYEQILGLIQISMNNMLMLAWFISGYIVKIM